MFAGHSKRPVAWTNQGRYSYSFLPGEQCYICSMKSLFSIGKTGFLHGLQVLDNTELSKWITSSDGPLYSGKFIYYWNIARFVWQCGRNDLSVCEILLGVTHPRGSMYRESPFRIMCYNNSSPGLGLPGVGKEGAPRESLPVGYIVTGFENNCGSVDHFCLSVFAN